MQKNTFHDFFAYNLEACSIELASFSEGGVFMRLNEKMPQLNGATIWLNSGIIGTDDLIGKPTLFHFWSVSCDMCKGAFPQINQLRDDYRGKLNVIAVHMPRSSDDLNMDVVEDVAKEYDIIHPINIDNDHRLTDLFSVNYVPAYFIFDEMGKLTYYQSGNSSIRTVLRRIDRLI